MGQVLAAADVNNWFIELAAVKTADQSLTSNTTFQNDSALVVAMAASVTYDFTCFVYFQAGTTGDIKIQWTVPSGTTLFYNAVHNEGGATAFNNSDLLFQAASLLHCAGHGAGSGATVAMNGTVVTSTTAGNLQMQWAQNASDATSTIVKASSRVCLRRVS